MNYLIDAYLEMLTITLLRQKLICPIQFKCNLVQGSQQFSTKENP